MSPLTIADLFIVFVLTLPVVAIGAYLVAWLFAQPIPILSSLLVGP